MARGCQHPTLPCLEPLFTGAFPALQGTGRGAGAEPPDPWAKLRAWGGSAGREHPLHPCTSQGCPVTWEELGLSPMGHSHLGRGVPARWGVASGTRGRMSGER